jgi:hypothetical protein
MHRNARGAPSLSEPARHRREGGPRQSQYLSRLLSSRFILDSGALPELNGKLAYTSNRGFYVMLIVFVHGWSVTNTNTYGGLPAALVKNASANFDLQVTHLYLSKYVSFADEVTVDDIARGMQNAITAEVLQQVVKGKRFACITHSTGGPVVRKWIDLYHRQRLDKCPIGHLIMLAPANHGSALAQLGKGRLARMKFFADGVQPGTGVLDWLELGSDQSWELNRDWLAYDCVAGGLYPFVFTGQTIDRAFYDNLNSYTGEAGPFRCKRTIAAQKQHSAYCPDALTLEPLSAYLVA